MLDKALKKKLKAEAHHLNPVIRVGQNGVTEGVVAETSSSLDIHELIKVHIHNGERDKRAEMAAELTAATGAELVHSIGKVFILYRERKEDAAA